MRDFIGPHGGEDGAAARIGSRQALQMRAQVALHLALSLRYESEARPIAQGAGEHPDRKRTHVPQGIQQARARTKLTQARFAPGKMITFFAGRLLQQLVRGARACRKRLTVVERLRGDLPGVIDAHQSGGMAAFGIAQFGGARAARNGPLGICRCEERPQGAVKRADERVEQPVRLHRLIIQGLSGPSDCALH